MATSPPPQIHDQTNILPRSRLLIVFAALASTMLITYIDQSSIGVALPTIGRDLNCASTIVWAGTSSMIANTVFQVLYGRFSDIFGRKKIMLSALGLLALADLLCGFAKSGPQLYGFRAVAGLANGGIMAICMMIVSDVVTLEERGKYQGILGSMVGLGNVIGPFMAAGFIQSSSWKWIFFLICPLAVLSGLVILFLVPASPMPKDDLKTKLSKIDYWGLVTSSTAIILLLIPISGLGSYFEVGSSMVISMLVIGGVATVLFVVVEWKVAKLPMIPLRLFKTLALCAMLIQNILIGITYYGILYYMPVYYQTVRQWSPLKSAALIVPLVGVQAVASSSAGYYISWKGSYGEVIWLGYACWTLAAGLHCMFTRNTHPISIAFILMVEGVGVGCVFQPTLIAAQAHSRKEDRAVVISARNFLRSAGGAAGLAIASTIFSNILLSNIPSTVPEDLVVALHGSTFSTDILGQLSEVNREGVLDAYMKAIRGVFILWACCIGMCLVLMVFVKDKGLKRTEERRGDEKEKVREGELVNTPVLVGEKVGNSSEIVTDGRSEDLDLEAGVKKG